MSFIIIKLSRQFVWKSVTIVINCGKYFEIVGMLYVNSRSALFRNLDATLSVTCVGDLFRSCLRIDFLGIVKV